VQIVRTDPFTTWLYIQVKRAWIIFWLLAILTIVLICFIGVFSKESKYELNVWKILAETNTSDNGYCFVRQCYTSFFFGDVKFGYVTRSGSKYSYPLEIDGFHWSGVRLVEIDGTIHVWRGRWETAIFNPNTGDFTNLIKNYTLGKTNGLYTGTGSSFFDLDSRMDQTNRH